MEPSGIGKKGDGRLLSVIVPVFNEQACIRPFVRAVDGQRLPVRLEFVFVDDGSSDGTLQEIKACAAEDARINWLSFSRNFGKEAAMLAGLDHAAGDLVVVMDADLQDPPDLLPEMLRRIGNGCDSVATRRLSRTGEPRVRSWCARRFYALMRRLSDVDLVDGARDFRLMTREMAAAVAALRETDRFTKGLYAWVGFKTEWLAYPNVPRAAGRTKWSFSRLFVYALSGFLSFSTRPLQAASCLGAALFAAAPLAFAGVVLSGVRLTGCGVLAGVIAFFTGLQLLALGVLGAYVAKIHRACQRRPAYILKEQKT